MGNITTNALLVLLPFPVLLNASITVRKRLFLAVVLGLGSFLIAINCVRLYRGMVLQGHIYTGRYVWSSVEMTVAVAVATLPTIYVLLKPSFRRWFRSGSAATKKGSRDEEGAAPILPPLAQPPPTPPLPPLARLATEKITGMEQGRIVAYDCASPQLALLPPTSPALSRSSHSTRRSSMPPLSPGWRVPMSSPNPLAGDTWGVSTWSGGSELDTCITGGAQARRHSVMVIAGEDQQRRRTSSCIGVGVGGRIFVETEVQQQVEVVGVGGARGGSPMGFVTPPPPVARFPFDSLV